LNFFDHFVGSIEAQKLALFHDCLHQIVYQALIGTENSRSIIFPDPVEADAFRRLEIELLDNVFIDQHLKSALVCIDLLGLLFVRREGLPSIFDASDSDQNLDELIPDESAVRAQPQEFILGRRCFHFRHFLIDDDVWVGGGGCDELSIDSA